MKYTGFLNEVNKFTEYEQIIGTSLDIRNLYEGRDIHKDLQVERVIGTTIFGRLSDCQGQPLGNQIVKLICNCQSDDGEYFKVVDQALTDASGCYRLETYGAKDVYYNIIVECEAPIVANVEPESISEEDGISSQERVIQADTAHQMNAYVYSQPPSPYMTLTKQSAGKFYANNTYAYTRS
ncbi:MAG: hypothetical protein ACRCW2_10530 [Cellulosilyticaceae bacterium]